MEIINAARAWSQRAINSARPFVEAASGFAARNRELLVGGVGGYMAGKIVEQIPIIGRLLRPLPSLLLSVGGAIYGRSRDVERRKLESIEKLNKS